MGNKTKEKKYIAKSRQTYKWPHHSADITFYYLLKNRPVHYVCEDIIDNFIFDSFLIAFCDRVIMGYSAEVLMSIME